MQKVAVAVAVAAVAVVVKTVVKVTVAKSQKLDRPQDRSLPSIPSFLQANKLNLRSSAVSFIVQTHPNYMLARSHCYQTIVSLI